MEKMEDYTVNTIKEERPESPIGSIFQEIMRYSGTPSTGAQLPKVEPHLLTTRLAPSALDHSIDIDENVKIKDESKDLDQDQEGIRPCFVLLERLDPRDLVERPLKRSSRNTPRLESRKTRCQESLRKELGYLKKRKATVPAPTGMKRRCVGEERETLVVHEVADKAAIVEEKARLSLENPNSRRASSRHESRDDGEATPQIKNEPSPGNAAVVKDFTSMDQQRRPDSQNKVCPQRTLTRGRQLKPQDRPFKCTLCIKAFPRKDFLAKHLQVHEGVRYFCEICKKPYVDKSYLTMHMRIHTKEKPYKCQICGKAFTWLNGLQKHMIVHSETKPYKCPVCTKTFKRESELKYHSNMHTGERLHKCLYCTKTFTGSSYLRIHLRLHTGERPYKCSLCSKSFTQGQHLKTHLRWHTGEKPFKCTVCDVRVSQSSHLKVHMLLHTGEKSFECSVCKEKFRMANTLRCHLLTHSGETRFECGHCGKRTIQRSALKQHITTAHLNLPRRVSKTKLKARRDQSKDQNRPTFKCVVCSKLFCHKTSFSRHMRIHRAEDGFLVAKSKNNKAQ